MKNCPTAYIIIAILTVLCMFSCSDDTAVMSSLDLAESMMEERPGTALAILDTMDRSQLKSRESVARHALLYSQALDRNYIDMTTDSIIRPAVEYYSRHGNADERLKAQYYLGCIYRNARNHEKEMECYVRAEQYVDEALDYKAVGRLYSAIKTLYFDLYDFDKAYRYSLLSAEYYRKSQNIGLHVKALLSAAHAANMQNNNFSVDSILKKIEKEYWDKSLSKSNISGYYAERLILAGNGSNGVEEKVLYKLLEKYMSEVPVKDVEWGVVANAYIKLGEVDSAAKALEYYCLTNPEYEESDQYHLLAALVKAMCGDYVGAYNSISEYRGISEAEDMMRIKSEAKFIRERYNNDVEIIRNKNIIVVLISLSVTIILVIVLVLMNVKQKLKLQKIKESEAQKRQKYLESINERLINEKTTLEKMQRMLTITEAMRKAVSNRHTAITHVLSLKVSYSESHLLEYVGKLLNEVMEDKEEFILSTMMSYSVAHPEFVNHLKEQGLTEWEAGYCCFYAMGLRGKEIGNLINNGSHSHHNRASVIRRKLGLGEKDMNLGQYCQKLLRELEKRENEQV